MSFRAGSRDNSRSAMEDAVSIASPTMPVQDTLKLNCSSCGERLQHTFVDLGMSPLANSYLTAEQLNQTELFFPLHTRVCSNCWLVQAEPVARPEEIFSDYAYFSSYSDMW